MWGHSSACNELSYAKFDATDWHGNEDFIAPEQRINKMKLCACGEFGFRGEHRSRSHCYGHVGK